jgi:hypothetical protein
MTDSAATEIKRLQRTSSAEANAVDSLSWRHEFLLRKFFEAVPDIELKDDQRGPDHSDNVSSRRTVTGLMPVFRRSAVKAESNPVFSFVRHRLFCKTIHAQAANNGQFVHFIHHGQLAVCRFIICN